MFLILILHFHIKIYNDVCNLKVEVEDNVKNVAVLGAQARTERKRSKKTPRRIQDERS